MTLKFPYRRQSPVSKKIKTYSNLDDVWDDINDLVNKWQDSPFTLGRNLYFHLPLFINRKLMLDDHDYDHMKEYVWTKEFNIPLAPDLNSADAHRLEIFDMIRQELNEITKYMSEKHGR